MIISMNAFYTICGMILAAAIIPAFYTGIKSRGKKKNPSLIIILLLLPLGFFTPAIYTVTDCGEYKKEVLILPKDGMTLGMHNYINNQSQHELFFEYLVYGNSTLDEDEIDMIIVPGAFYKAPTSEINYVFEPIPSTISIKGDGAIRHRLSCDVPDYEEEMPQELLDSFNVKDSEELKNLLIKDLGLEEIEGIEDVSLRELIEFSMQNDSIANDSIE